MSNSAQLIKDTLNKCQSYVWLSNSTVGDTTPQQQDVVHCCSVVE